MKYITLIIAALFATPAFAVGPSNTTCQLDIPCELDSGRSYHVKVPDDWDGKAKLPVLMHFHGWQRTGALPVQHQRISVGLVKKPTKELRFQWAEMDALPDCPGVS